MKFIINFNSLFPLVNSSQIIESKEASVKELRQINSEKELSESLREIVRFCRPSV